MAPNGPFDTTIPASWPWIGPPAPSWTKYAARCSMLALITLTAFWVHMLGGLGLRPTPAGSGNDTGCLFNWHPLLMVLAFGVFMPEAILSYRAPLVQSSRPTRKTVHWSLHSAAIVCAALGLLAAFQSHNLKLPVPIPNLYSVHSVLGLFTVLLAGLQYGLGGFAYLWPKLTLGQRMALGPVHRFLGTSVWTLGLASIGAGVQEKATFVQMGRSLSGSGLYASVMRVPGLITLSVAMLLLFVLYHFAQPAATPAAVERSRCGGYPVAEQDSLLPSVQQLASRSPSGNNIDLPDA